MWTRVSHPTGIDSAHGRSLARSRFLWRRIRQVNYIAYRTTARSFVVLLRLDDELEHRKCALLIGLYHRVDDCSCFPFSRVS